MKALYISTNLLIILGVAFSQILCPPEESIKPCRCTNSTWPVTYKCKNISYQEELERIFKTSSAYSVDALGISDSSILHLPIDWMRAKNTKFLLYNRCRFSSVFDHPIGTPYEMYMIQIVDSSFLRGIDWNMFKSLRVATLHVEQTTIKRIGESFSANVDPFVSEITLASGRIASVEANAFSRLVNLENLLMPYNKIKELRRSMFPIPGKLRLMDFSENRISQLPDDIFHQMPHLRDVLLAGNFLHAFPALIWEKAIENHLSQATLDNNFIVCDCGLNWFAKRRRSLRITGKCAGPTNKQLTDLSPEDFKLCPK